MAYLPKFEHDIFISYSHVDNLPGSRRGDWFARFKKELVDRLNIRLGGADMVRVWWDGKLDGSQVFDRKIEKVIAGSALFLAMTSEGYLNSAYCKKELESFCRKAEREPAGLVVGDRARVLNVLLDDIHYERWPARYGGANGYRFNDAETGDPVEVTRKPFIKEINKLVNVVCEILKTLRDERDNDNDNDNDNDDKEEPFTVFVADTATTLKTLRARVYSDLGREGVRVTDLVPLPPAAREHDEAAVKKIKEAALCVHLLDEVPGREIDDRPEKSYLERQAELSLEHARSQLVWVPTELTPPRVEEIEDAAHKALLQRLAGGPRREGADYKFIRTLPSAISQDILAQVEQIKKRRLAAAAASAQGGARTALIDIHLKDWQYALALSRSLLEREVVTSFNREEDSPQKNLKGFEDQLRRADLLIIVYGDVQPEWVHERLGEALKIVAGSPQNCALRACGVYLAPPRKKDEEAHFKHPLLPIEVLDNTERFNPQTLDTLLSKIQVGA
jgi:hypothetical protein